MAKMLLYMSKTGCGKSTSLHSLDPKTTFIIKPNSKPLPFPKGGQYSAANQNQLQTANLADLNPTIAAISTSAPHIKTVVIEDFTHFFSARIFSAKFRSRNQGGEAFARWNDFAGDVYASFIKDHEKWREDLTIVVLHHTETKDDGSTGFKTSGKLLDNSIQIPGYFTYILHGIVREDAEGRPQYGVVTNKTQGLEAKTPSGMFPLLIPNDMQYILDTINNYTAPENSENFKPNYITQ